MSFPEVFLGLFLLLIIVIVVGGIVICNWDNKIKDNITINKHPKKYCSKCGSLKVPCVKPVYCEETGKFLREEVFGYWCRPCSSDYGYD